MTPVAVALPRPDEKLEQGRFGTMRPVTPAPGFMVMMPIKPGMADKVRAHGKTLEAAVTNDPTALAILRLHYLRWAVFDDDTRFLYMGIFDTDFDKYLEDGIAIFKSTGTSSIFDCLEGCPEDWKENPAAVAKYFSDHQVDSFCEYAEYPDVTGVEVVKALQVKQSFSDMLDQMQ